MARTEHTCKVPMFTGIIPGCKRCQEIADKVGFEPYLWHTMKSAQENITKTERSIVSESHEEGDNSNE